MTRDSDTEPAVSDELTTAFGAEVAEEMRKFGISRVSVDYFHYKEFRYTNLRDALAQAKRQQTGPDLVRAGPAGDRVRR